MSEKFFKSLPTILIALAASFLIQCSGAGSPQVPPSGAGGNLGLPSLDGSPGGMGIGGNPATGPQPSEDYTPKDHPQVADVEVTLSEADEGENSSLPTQGELDTSRYMAYGVADRANIRDTEAEEVAEEENEGDDSSAKLGEVAFPSDTAQEVYEPPPPFNSTHHPYVWVVKNNLLQKVNYLGAQYQIYDTNSWGVTRVYFDYFPRFDDPNKPCSHHFSVHACYFDGENYYQAETKQFSCPNTNFEDPPKVKMPLKRTSAIIACPPQANNDLPQAQME